VTSHSSEEAARRIEEAQREYLERVETARQEFTEAAERARMQMEEAESIFHEREAIARAHFESARDEALRLIQDSGG